MKEVYIKKHWEEEDILFYIHFLNRQAVRQLEISNDKRIYMTSENPISGDSMLYDQDIEGLDLIATDFISKNEFEEAWLKNS